MTEQRYFHLGKQRDRGEGRSPLFWRQNHASSRFRLEGLQALVPTRAALEGKSGEVHVAAGEDDTQLWRCAIGANGEF